MFSEVMLAVGVNPDGGIYTIVTNATNQGFFESQLVNIYQPRHWIYTLFFQNL